MSTSSSQMTASRVRTVTEVVVIRGDEASQVCLVESGGDNVHPVAAEQRPCTRDGAECFSTAVHVPDRVTRHVLLKVREHGGGRREPER